MAEICPYTENCIIYKNWVKETGDENIDVIKEYPEGYECLAKSSLEGRPFYGLKISRDKIKKRLSNLSSPCSHITLLNLLNKMQK